MIVAMILPPLVGVPLGVSASRLRRLLRPGAAVEGLVIVDDDEPDAYALPGLVEVARTPAAAVTSVDAEARFEAAQHAYVMAR